MFLAIAVWTHFQHMFNAMPLAGVVGKKIFCCHGGISQNLYNWEQTKKIYRPTDICDTGLLCDLLWADPFPNDHVVKLDKDKNEKWFEPSPRGISQMFGKNAVRDFCNYFDLDLIIRGHQCVMGGVELSCEDHCLTVFSAPWYCQEVDNLAGVVHVDKKMRVQMYKYR